MDVALISDCSKSGHQILSGCHLSLNGQLSVKLVIGLVYIGITVQYKVNVSINQPRHYKFI